MKRNVVVCVWCVWCAASVWGQQALWSTGDIGEDEKWRFTEGVMDNAEDLYDTYRYYTDMIGFSREGFVEEYPCLANLVEVPEYRVFAFADCVQGADVVFLFIVKKGMVDVLMFTNMEKEGMRECVPYGKDVFLEWFLGLL